MNFLEEASRHMKKTLLYLCMLTLLALSLVACPGGEDTPPPTGPIDPATCTHDFGAWTPVVPATCEQDGTEKRTCTLCSTEEEQVAPALTHVFSEEFFSDGEIHFNPCSHDGCLARANERAHTYAPSNRCYDCADRRESDAPAFTFAHVSGGYAIVGYNGEAETVTIPAEYLGEPVIAIGADAFLGCREIKRLSFGSSGLLEIDDQAFFGCTSLTFVELPRCVERVGKRAFAGCTALSGISFGFNSNLKEIDSYAFADCKKLSVFTVQSKVNYIGAYAFSGCSSLASVTFITTAGWYVDGTAVNVRNDGTNADYLTEQYVGGSFCHN